MLAVCTAALAQSKLTPQAQLRIATQRAKTVDASRNTTEKNRVMAENTITLVVKVDESHASRTFAQMKAAGAIVKSKLGHQAVVSLPLDSVEALEQIEGVVRIDKGHLGKRKTDVTRSVTGVNQLNGPTLPADATGYTGKGVNVCIIDGGIDFQHPAFKDDEGRSRIKCVYMMGNDNGNKFTVDDPEAGEYTFPGSVFDTPELIATLTTDDVEEYHGTHTASIAAGSLTPQGFGGMAPEADLVLIPIREEEVEGFDEIDAGEYFELALAFASAYADQSNQPTVLSVSANSHGGPHDGTSTITEAIAAASEHLIPVFSVGNEGDFPIHLYQKFTAKKTSVSTILLGLMEDETGEYEYLTMSDVTGYTRTGSEVSIQLKLVTINFTGRLATAWTSEKCTATPGCEPVIVTVDSEDNNSLSKYFEGQIILEAADNGDERLTVKSMLEGGLNSMCLFVLTVSGADGTEVDLWDNVAGFGGQQLIGLSGYVDGKSDMSAGDWTSTDRVISVGAYCSNTTFRNYEGEEIDTSIAEDEDSEVYELNDIAYFSSYGTSFNGIEQPTVCAPGVNIVSAWSHYCIDEGSADEDMMWQDYPYGAESGTSMSCPAVAGIIALWLEADPTLTLDDLKDVLANTSVNDDFTEASPERWGYGKIDASAGIAYILEKVETGIKSITDDRHAARLYDLQGRPVVNAPRHGLYLRQGKKIIY